MPLKDLKYKYNQTFLKIYGSGDNRKIKVISLRCLRNSGVEDPDEFYSERCTVNDDKLLESIIRAKSRIFDLAFCNPWQYFFTGTLDKEKYDRTDLEKFHKDFTIFIRNKNRFLEQPIKFLVIPELHSDLCSWHLHGFLMNVPENELHQFQIGDTMSYYLAGKVMKGFQVFDWFSYSKKFGFCDLEPIRSPEAISKYITKYINKDLGKSVTELNAHLYYHSRGLATADIVKVGNFVPPYFPDPDFSSDFVSVNWFPYSDELLEELKDYFVYIDFAGTRVKL